MLFGPATCANIETSRKCCFILLLAMMVKLPGSVVDHATCDDGETSRKCCLALLLEMIVKLPGRVVWPCYLR